MNKSHGEQKGVKGPLNDFELVVESSSDMDLSTSSKSKQEKRSEIGNLSSNKSSVNKSKKVDNSNYVADCTCSKLLQQAEDDLSGETY